MIDSLGDASLCFEKILRLGVQVSDEAIDIPLDGVIIFGGVSLDRERSQILLRELPKLDAQLGQRPYLRCSLRPLRSRSKLNLEPRVCLYRSITNLPGVRASPWKSKG